MRRFKYYKPRSLDEVWKVKEKEPEARFIAGGTDLMIQIRNGELSPPALISLRSIPELAFIEVDGSARIGALTPISDLIHHQELLDKFPVLVEAAKRLGCVQIRNVASIGGNLCNCSPCADMALPLLVLEAKVRLQGIKKSRIIPLNEFFIGPGESCLAPHEILAEILVDSPPQKAKTIFLKKGRVKMDLAVVSVAVLLEMDGKRCRKARLAAGSVAPVPLRLSNVEGLLEGATISKEIVAQAQQLASENISPITDIRSTSEYRRQIMGVYVRRALETLLE